MQRSLRRPARLLALRWHLLGLTGATLLPVILFGAVLVHRVASEKRDETERVLLRDAQVLAAALDREIAVSVRALDTLARSELLARGDLVAFRREAERVDAAQPSWLAIVLFTPDGARIMDTREEGPGGTTVDRASFDAAVRSGSMQVGDLVRARDGRTWAFALRVPVMQEGAVRYVLSAAVSALEIGRAASIGGPGELEWTRTIVDRAGQVVARTRSPELFVGQKATAAFLSRITTTRAGLFRDRTFEGIGSVVGYARAPLSGWTASVVASADVVDAPVQRVTSLLVGVGLAMLAASGAAAFLFSRRFSRAIASAASAAEALAEGARAEVRPAGIREVAQLGEALRSSARLLEARRCEAEEHLARAAAARNEAVASSRAKDEFLAMLGHELRNPLSPIVTALRLLRQRGSAWGREHEIVERQVGHLVRLVEDLLDVSRVTRAQIRLHPEPIELFAAVARAVEMASPLLEARQHRLAVDVPCGLVVRADPVRLAQVIGNLLTNSARYTPPGGHVHVTGGRDPDGVSLEVTDDGQGITADLLPRVFDLFVQGARTPDRAVGGLGIGLAIVRSLVGLHGGRVEAHSDGPGRGSTFRFVLPSADRPEDAAALLAAVRLPRRSGRPLRILIVDDNEDAATLLADFLAEAGHDVQVAHDGPAALAAVDGSRPEIAVLDIGLPVMDGYELAARLREKLGAAAPAFVCVTGYGQPRDLDRSGAAGFRRHFVKPADPTELLAAIEELGGALARAAS
ncbi:MAG TPA: ATP-binding protein [Anaeromyxobacter sp.]